MRKFKLILKLVIKIWLLSMFMSLLLGGSIFRMHINEHHFPISIGSNINLADYTKVVGGKAIVPTLGIDEVLVQFISGDVTVLPYDGDAFQIDYQGGTVDCYYRVDGDTLTICPEFNQHINFGIGTTGDRDGDLTLYVPQTLTNLELSVETVSSEVDISIYGKSLKVENVSGDVLTLATFHEIDASTVSGNTEVASVTDYPLSELDCESVSGNLYLSGDFNYRLDISSISGDKDSHSTASAGNEVDISFDSVSGNFRSK